MGDTGDYFKDWNKHFKKVRKNCKETRLEWLFNSGLDFEIKSESAGHIRIFTENGNYDVWLGTGKWTKVGTNKYRQGWGQLLKQLK